jgi:hypothetical protein
VLVVLTAIGCAPLVVTPPPKGVEHIAVLAANNRTGDELFVEAPYLLPSILGSRPRATVLDVLSEEARVRLADHGFRVANAAEVHAATGGKVPRDPLDAARIAAEGGLEGAALYIEVSIWEPDEHSRPSYVTAKLDLVLVDPTTGRSLWEAHWPARPVAAGDTGTVALAYPIAARDLIAKMTANLTLARPSGAPPEEGA